MNKQNEQITIIGTLDRINYPKLHLSIDSGEYAIVKIKVKEVVNGNLNGLYVSVKGNFCALQIGDKLKADLELISTHELYGDTYKLCFSHKIVDLKDENSQKNFLKQIIPERLVENLYSELDNVIETIENKDIEKLCNVQGIGLSTAEKIITRYDETKDFSLIYSELRHTGITLNMIQKIVKHYKSPDVALETIKFNPYRLVEINGVGFRKADEIALKTGIDSKDKRRLIGYIYHTLSEQGETGKSYVYYKSLVKDIKENIGETDEEKIKLTISELHSQGTIIKLGDKIALKKYYDLELKIKKELLRINNSDISYKFPILNTSTINKRIEATEQKQGFKFVEAQLKGIKESIKNNVIAITGGAGTGKTSTAKGICEMYPYSKIMAVALSGRASLRITEATGYTASTIHKALGINELGIASFNLKKPLDLDILLIDEATMINGDLILKLLYAVPTGAKVIFMGDVQQLTPIGNCQVFADILESKAVTTIILTEPHRQALKSGIITNSIKVSKQQQIFDKSYNGTFISGELKDMEFCIEPYESDRIPYLTLQYFSRELTKYKSLLDVHIITPLRDRGMCSCKVLNKTIQKALRKNKPDDELHISNNNYDFYIGDKIINTKNNYKTKNIEDNLSPIFNGSIGVIEEIQNDEMLVKFLDGEEIWITKDLVTNIELGYATTIHKLQGSEFKSIIVAIDTNSYIMQNCELLYTAITRAKEYCSVISTSNCIHNCISKKETKTKQTFLKDFLTNNT